MFGCSGKTYFGEDQKNTHSCYITTINGVNDHQLYGRLHELHVGICKSVNMSTMSIEGEIWWACAIETAAKNVIADAW
jgi:hypothetical protein